MRYLILRDRRLVSGILIAVFAVAMLADCARPAQATDAQKACCAAMAKGCGAMAQQHGCCKSESSGPEQATLTSRISVATPDVAAVFILPATWHLPLVSCFDLPYRPFERPPGNPSSVLTSILRL